MGAPPKLEPLGRLPVKQYDDGQELYRYLTEHLSSMLTDQERRIARAFLGEAKAANSSENMAAMLRKNMCSPDDKTVQSWLRTGRRPFAATVLARLEQDDPTFRVNRCAECQCIVATPVARQCFWCGHDWH